MAMSAHMIIHEDLTIPDITCMVASVIFLCQKMYVIDVFRHVRHVAQCTSLQKLPTHKINEMTNGNGEQFAQFWSFSFVSAVGVPTRLA